MPDAMAQLDAKQWDVFVSEYWGKRPVLLTGVFASPLLDDHDVLAMLRRGAARMRAVPLGALPGSDVRDLFYFAGDDPSFPVETVSPFPIADDTTVTGYYDRVRSLLGGQDYSLLVQDVQAHPGLWERALAFLRPLHERVGLPPYVSRCECFLGKYSASPVGVHLDSAHVFTFVLCGRKRFQAWPNQFPREAPDLPGSLRATYEKYLDRAITLEAGVNDLIYWPPSYWHVAENFTFSATITMLWEQWNLRLPKDPCVHSWLAGVISERAPAHRGASESALPAPLANARDRFVASLQGAELEDTLWKAWLERTSKLAFNGAAMLSPVTLRDGELLVANEPVQLEWARLSSGRLLCAANGQSFEVDHPEEAAALLARIVRPEPWTLAGLTQDFPRLDGAAIREIVEHALRLRAVVPVVAQ